jgi:gamma-glutamyltranspeptidase/glutathione hydrolase
MTSDIFMESRIPKETQEALKAKGHKISVRGEMDLYFGGAQGVMVDAKAGKLFGAADPRRDGFAKGY